jgi:hypothetical protein
MTTTMDNLEKLIQMATIEHMYSMLQKMKNDNTDNFKECNFSDEKYSQQNNALIGSLLGEIKHLKTEINDHTEKLRRNNGEIWQLTQSLSFWREKTEKLENELNEIKSNTNNNSRFLCQQIRGQQKLTSYPGFSNGSSHETDDEAHIKLKIEEKLSNDESCDADKESNHSDEEDEQEQEEQEEEEQEQEEEEEEEEEEDDVNPALITCSTITLDVKPIVEEVHEPTVESSEEEEEESEEEVGTDDEKEVLGNVEIQPPVQDQKEEEQEEVEEEADDELSVGEELGEHIEPVEEEPEEEAEEPEEEEAEEEEAEEEEEVFEIEIDDVTYFATGEENGILYEMTADGDIGKKVGIIKDGEPIFN